MMRSVVQGVVASTLFLAGAARAEIAPECADTAIAANYDERVQQDFQQNHFALSASFSPIHAAIPHAGGRGAITLDVNVIPPLSCSQRFVLEGTKTEDTNKSPVLPRITGSYSFPTIAERLVVYSSFGFLPPVPVGGTRNLVVSGELGFGVMAHEYLDVGARFHTTLQRTYGDVATAFSPEEPDVEDVFVGSTWGFDVLLSVPIEVGPEDAGHVLSPFVSVGYLNASTYFFVGDSAYVANNYHPYSGAAVSAGLDALVLDHLRLGAELYGAPGGYSLPDPPSLPWKKAPGTGTS